MIVTSLLILAGALLLVSLRRSNAKSRRLSLPTWREIATQLQPTQNAGIKALALDYMELQTSGNTRTYAEIWDMVGGAEGLTRMKENSEVLIALASYAERWNHDDSIMATERMRHDARALRRAVVGLGIGLTCGYGRARVLTYVHEAATSYHLMRERLLSLYKTNDGEIRPSLEGLI